MVQIHYILINFYRLITPINLNYLWNIGYIYFYYGIPIAYAMIPMDTWENLGIDLHEDQEILIEEGLDKEENVHQDGLPDPAGPEVLPGPSHKDSLPTSTNVDPSTDEVKTCWEKVKSCFGF